MQGGWGADFATRFGGTMVQRLFVFFLFVCIFHPQGATSVSAVPFTITVGETYALCDLDFETNLRKIDFAQVQQMISRNVTPTDIFISFTTPGFLWTLFHIFSWVLVVWSDETHMEFLRRHRFPLVCRKPLIRILTSSQSLSSYLFQGETCTTSMQQYHSTRRRTLYLTYGFYKTFSRS